MARPANEERKAAGLVLALVVAGTIVRLVAGGEAPGGQVGYRVGAGPRPDRDSVRTQAARIGRPLGPGERVDVDRSPASELARLPGIGPGLAARIVRDRDDRGPYGSLEGLARVPGIGPVVLERVRSHVSFSLRAQRADTESAGRGRRIRINTASAAELATLPGIGPAKARAIVEDRTARGPFRTVADLVRVRGIGPATLEAITPLVVVP